jgi:oligoendopeptidase F
LLGIDLYDSKTYEEVATILKKWIDEFAKL